MRDLERWGISFDKNTSKPYFEGHEREDVVEKRKEFVEYFSTRLHNYYRPSEDKIPAWISPSSDRPVILISHDETTHKSGEQSSRSWSVNDNPRFHNKGRGRSWMCSDFFVLHPTGPFFELDDDEWELAVQSYPSLFENNQMYSTNTASAAMCPGGESYFDNDVILEQFERMFQMIQFKKDFENHKIEFLVDNATTHTALVININDFQLNIGGRCQVEQLQWKVDDVEHTLKCFFDRGPNKGLHKGLKVLAKELGLQFCEKIKLPDLKVLLLNHPAFKPVSKLENLAEHYDIKIIFVPKYHCEFNPIEGVWCWQKGYTRTNTDQKFSTMLKLIDEARELFKDGITWIKLWRRFWRVIYGYNVGTPFQDILHTYFSGKSNEKIVAHRKIYNTLLDHDE